MEVAEADAAVEATLAIVKQISADSIIIQGIQDSDNVAPPTKKVGLSHINVPKMGIPARKVANKPEIKAVPSQPFCLEAREFLRKTLVGKVVSFIPTFVVPGSNKEVGIMCLGRNWKLNIAVEMVAKGLATVRPSNDPYSQFLLAVEKLAKEKKLNIWSSKSCIIYDPTAEVSVDELFANSSAPKVYDGVVEHVRDGCSYRLMLLPDYHYINIQLVGISNVPGHFTEQARQFAECRLLQRDVEVKLYIPTGVQGTVFGSMVTKKDTNDIALYLLSNGLVKICPWNLKYVKEYEHFYKEAEKKARNDGLGYWADKENQNSELTVDDNTSSLDSPGSSFEAEVVYVNGTENLQVQRIQDNRLMQIYLSSIRVNRLQTVEKNSALQLQVAFEIREFLRKWLVGKRCRVLVDYNYQQTQGPVRLKKCCTVYYHDRNVAVELVKRGYATVLRYRNDDVNRSIAYADLLNAEGNYQKSKKSGGPMVMPATNIVRLSGESARARLGIFRQQKQMPAIVEWVLSGSRFVLLVDSTSVITMSLTGVMCPRTDDQDSEIAEIGVQALNLSRKQCLQRDVFIQISSLDRNGNCFQGFLTLKDAKEHEGNIAIMLLSQGLGSVYQPGLTAQKSNAQLLSRYTAAENEAREAKRGLWSTKVITEQESKKPVPPIDDDNDDDDVSSPLAEPIDEINPITTFKAFLSYADNRLNIYVQNIALLPNAREALLELSRMMNATKADDTATYKRDEIVAVRTEAESWSRGLIRQQQDGLYDIFLIDSGSSMTKVNPRIMRKMPGDCRASGLQPLAVKIRLAFVRRIHDEDMLTAIQLRLAEASDAGEEFEIKVIYRIDNVNYALVILNQVNLNQEFLENGYVALCKPQSLPRKFRNASILSEFQRLESAARDSRKGIWSYGNWIEDLEDSEEETLKK